MAKYVNSFTRYLSNCPLILPFSFFCGEIRAKKTLSKLCKLAGSTPVLLTASEEEEPPGQLLRLLSKPKSRISQLCFSRALLFHFASINSIFKPLFFFVI